MKIITQAFKHFMRTDGTVMAPPLTWKTSEIGSKIRYLKNSFKDWIEPNQVGKEFANIMYSKPDKDMAAKACEIFTKETGIKMFMTNPMGAFSFSTLANIVIRDIKEGNFPKDIKYIVMGHGSGSTINDTWHVMADPNVKIFDFIREHVPAGEKVLVQCCENTPKKLRHLLPKNKPAIGYPTSELYSSYKHPGKIVISGRDEIIGGYGNGIASYYV